MWEVRASLPPRTAGTKDELYEEQGIQLKAP